MISMTVHHVGYLVKNIEKSKTVFMNLGYSLEQDTVYDSWRDVDICFLIKDSYRIELVAPRSSESVVGSLRKKIGNTPYHICYEVEDLNKAIAELSLLKFVIWEDPHEAPALDGRKVAFLINGQIGMIELVEKE